MNALFFSDTNFVFSRLTDHGEEERKRHDLALEKFQKARDKWNEAKEYNNNVAEAMLEHYRVFADKRSLCHPSLSYQIFIINQRHKKMVNYYLLRVVKALQHMPSIYTLNK